MNKNELAATIARVDGITQKEALRRIDLTFDIIKAQLQQHNTVKLRGFGTFATAIRAEKKIINPGTKKKEIIPERHVPTFAPSNVLRDIVRNQKGRKI